MDFWFVERFQFSMCLVRSHSNVGRGKRSRWLTSRFFNVPCFCLLLTPEASLLRITWVLANPRGWASSWGILPRDGYGINPQDPRATGPPCMGDHTPAVGGRGSVTGSSKHATWIGCEACGIRLQYTPAFGAHALCRQAGPLPADVTRGLAAKTSIGRIENKLVRGSIRFSRPEGAYPNPWTWKP